MPTIQYSARNARLSVHKLITSCIRRGLVSRDSIVDGDWLPASDLPCCQPTSDVAENFERFLVRSAQRKKTEKSLPRCMGCRTSPRTCPLTQTINPTLTLTLTLILTLPIFMPTSSPPAVTWQRCYFQVAFGVQIPCAIRHNRLSYSVSWPPVCNKRLLTH